MKRRVSGMRTWSLNRMTVNPALYRGEQKVGKPLLTRNAPSLTTCVNYLQIITSSHSLCTFIEPKLSYELYYDQLSVKKITCKI